MGLLIPGKIYPGSTVRITGTFLDQDDSDTDPSVSIVFKLRSPSGVETSYTYGTDAAVQRQNEGDYACDVLVTEGGRWRYRWEASSGETVIYIAGEGTIVVQASTFDGYTGTWGSAYT